MSALQNQFQVSTALVASSQDTNLISNWAGRFAPFRVLVTILINATTAGVRMVVSSGTRAMVPKSQVQGGGTAGTLPSSQNATPIQFVAEPGEEIQLLVTEVLAGTPTCNLAISWEAI